MTVTVIILIMIILAIMLMMYSAVGLIQDTKLFSSAPPDVQDAILPHEERFRGAHILGWLLFIISWAIIILGLIYAFSDGFSNHFGFWDFFIRFLILFIGYKIFDIIFIDWILLTKTHFFQHFYPETENCEGYRVYGFNKKQQIAKLIVFPVISLLLSGIATLF